MLPLRGAGGRTLRRIHRGRAVSGGLLLLILVLVGAHSWSVPLLRDLEAQAFDWYSTNLAQRSAPRDDIVVLTFDEATAREYGQFSPPPRRLIADALRNLDPLGAKAFGIDIGMTVRTQDAPQLADALSRMATRIIVAFADPEFDQATYWSADSDTDAKTFQAEFWASINNSNVHQATPVVSLDHDGVGRRWPRLPSMLRRPLSSEMIADEGHGGGYRGSIDYILGAEAADAGAGVFHTIPLSAFGDPQSAAAFADLVKDRYVLIGVDIENVDQATIPVFTDEDNTVSGVYVHAQMLAQALDGRLRSPVPTALSILLLIITIAGAVITAVVGRNPWYLLIAVVAQAGVVLVLPLAIQGAGYDRLSLPFVGIALTWLAAFLSALLLLRSTADARTRFAQGALGRFLPKTVASEIIRDPSKLDLAGQRRNLFIMFTDLEGFTSFSHALDPQIVAELLNDYLDLVAQIILRHEGTLDKYVGDAVIAIWGAPLQSDRDAANALACAVEILRETEGFRARWRSRGLSLGRTRIGLHFGEAIVGNFGGERIQYTAIGDAVNTAARLEGLNKYLGSSILVSRDAAEKIDLAQFLPLGRVKVSGRSTPIEIYEPRMGADAELAAEVRMAYSKYENGDPAAAELIAKLGAERHDEVLTLFAQRITSHRPGDAYVFEEK